ARPSQTVRPSCRQWSTAPAKAATAASGRPAVRAARPAVSDPMAEASTSSDGGAVREATAGGCPARTRACSSAARASVAVPVAPAAVAAFAGAVDHWRQLGLTVWLGRALSLQAAAARHAGDHPAADRLLTQASELLDRLKAPAHARPSVLAPLGSQQDGT
ncbi:MAG TPA: hypothetical protein VFN05_06535, partial [Actinomycetes bacterium]|nr:hypothetical protein [Actinomycetes bacterium]